MRSATPPDPRQGLSRRRPRIGITGPVRGGTAAWLCAGTLVRLAGGRPLRITAARPRDITEVQGLIVGGGADIDPKHYPRERPEDAPPPPKVDSSPAGKWSWLAVRLITILRAVFKSSAAPVPDVPRDALELELISAALRRRVPVLGICRGMQMLNVGLGGGLRSDIRGLYTEVPYLRTVLPRKRVRLDPESRLASLLGRHECRVNSLHHQAVETLGRDLSAVAWEDTGIVQAVEAPAHPFVIGVQWHPEYMPQQRSQRRLFRALVDAARLS